MTGKCKCGNPLDSNVISPLAYLCQVCRRKQDNPEWFKEKHKEPFYIMTVTIEELDKVSSLEKALDYAKKHPKKRPIRITHGGKIILEWKWEHGQYHPDYLKQLIEEYDKNCEKCYPKIIC